MRISTLFALALACSSCKHISFDSHPFAVEHPANTAPGGLEWHDLYIGEGPAAAAGDGVVFDYTLWLGDGTRVDSTLDRGVPLEAVIGSLPLEGLNQGLVGMRPGGGEAREPLERRANAGSPPRSRATGSPIRFRGKDQPWGFLPSQQEGLAWPSQPAFMPSQPPLLHSAFGMLAPLGSVTAWLEFDLQPKENAISVATRRRFFMWGLFAAAGRAGNRRRFGAGARTRSRAFPARGSALKPT